MLSQAGRGGGKAKGGKDSLEDQSGTWVLQGSALSLVCFEVTKSLHPVSFSLKP